MIRRALVLVAAMAAVAAAQGKAIGVVIGVITVDSTRGVVNARINMKGVSEVRTDSSGRFTLRDVPAGGHEIEVRAIGLGPASFDVTVAANDTARVQVNLDTKTPTLDSVKVKGTSKVLAQLRSDFIDRRKQGLGHYMDSTELGKYSLLRSAFDGVAGLKVKRQTGTKFTLELRGGCPANVWIDGVRQRQLVPISGYVTDWDYINDLQSDMIAAVEVYPSELTAPPQYSAKGCGSVLLWTKRNWPP